jgi:signal peptidase II
LKKALLIIFAVLSLDQWIKIWVKLNFHYGESKELIPGWLDLQFVENPGMAFGWMLPGEGGKLTLSIFRIVVVAVISIYLYKLIKQKAHWGYITSVSLIVAGAMGNIIDSAIYGVLFDKGSLFDPDQQDFTMYFGKATMNGEGYTKPLLGNVVDMLHFTKEFTWNGVKREIFPPVFNIADSSITTGIISILLFQRKFFTKPEGANELAATQTVQGATQPDEQPLINQHDDGERISQWPTHDKEEAD